MFKKPRVEDELDPKLLSQLANATHQLKDTIQHCHETTLQHIDTLINKVQHNSQQIIALEIKLYRDSFDISTINLFNEVCLLYFSTLFRLLSYLMYCLFFGVLEW